MSNTLLLMMGGNGTRFGAPIPKQFTVVGNKSIFEYIVDIYDSSDLVDNIVIVCNPEWIVYASRVIIKKNTSKRIAIVPGGKTRSNSIKNGLLSIKSFSKAEDRILIHDATHPYLDIESVQIALEKMTEYDGATLCQCEYDTCYMVSDGQLTSEIPKKSVVSGASPEIFRFRDLEMMYSKTPDDILESMSSAGALALEHGLKVA